jgi:hypothetical protein
MLPVLEGTIARRVLLNFRVDSDVARRLLPAPLKPVLQHGYAVAGVCLIAFEKLRPKCLPAAFGFSSENMAHRIAVRFPTENGRRDGVYIWRRETDHPFVHRFGGRLFPGVNGSAAFAISDTPERLAMHVKTPRADADVSFEATPAFFHRSVLFETFDGLSDFFRRGDCGFSCATNGALEGMQLQTQRWEMSPLNVQNVRAGFFDDETRFPRGSVVFDCGVLMRNIPHEWHELPAIGTQIVHTAEFGH